jgi:hypothetical protein
VLERDLRSLDGLLADPDSLLGLDQHDDNSLEGGEAGIQTPVLQIVGWTDKERHY